MRVAAHWLWAPRRLGLANCHPQELEFPRCGQCGLECERVCLCMRAWHVLVCIYCVYARVCICSYVRSGECDVKIPGFLKTTKYLGHNPIIL